MNLSYSAANFLLIRLGAVLPENTVMKALAGLFHEQDHGKIPSTLSKKISDVPSLTTSHKEWLYGNTLLPLEKEELYLIFSKGDIFDCSIKLRSEVNKIEEALCELVPYMVRQYHQMHSRLSVVSV